MRNFYILGYLNASSIAEELELGKQKMRNSARLSLDESLTVYPVQFSPNNWFKALSPNLNPEDLTMAKDSIRDIYFDKQKELSRVKADLQKVELMSISPADAAIAADNAQVEVETAKKKVSEAEKIVIDKYGEGVVGVAKIYFNLHFRRQKIAKALIDKEKLSDLGVLDPSGDYMKSLTEAVDGIIATQEAQEKLTTAIESLSSALAIKSEVESKVWELNKETMRQRVSELEMDVKYYGDLLVDVAEVAAKQTRIEITRKSYTNNTLVYRLAIPDTVNGGSFTMKLGSKAEVKIDIENVKIAEAVAAVAASESHAAVDAVDAVTPDKVAKAIEKVLKAAKDGKEDYKDAKVTSINGSSGYYLVTFTSQTEEDLIINEKDLLPPAIAAKEPNILPKQVSPEDAETQGMFTDIVIKISSATDETETSAKNIGSTSKWQVGSWFASASSSKGKTDAILKTRSDFFSNEIEIGFRVAKVSFDRGGWFNPQIFKMSASFTRLADISVSPGKTVADIQETHSDPKTLDNMFKDAKGHSYVLPAFPVAMAVAKDVTIKVKKTNMSSAAAKSVVEKTSASSGGFLCFSTPSSSSGKNSSESSMHGSHGEYYYIRIPGPQILGYFLQMVSKDYTELYEPIENGKTSFMEALELYNDATTLLKSSSEILKAITPVTRTDDDKPS